MIDWVSRKDEIQARFFRPPPYARLWIEYSPVNDLLSWSFTFMDLGMCHTISYNTTIAQENGSYRVGRESWPNEDMALEAVFGGHYNNFLNEFYMDMTLESASSDIIGRMQESLSLLETSDSKSRVFKYDPRPPDPPPSLPSI